MNAEKAQYVVRDDLMRDIYEMLVIAKDNAVQIFNDHMSLTERESMTRMDKLVSQLMLKDIEKTGRLILELKKTCPFIDTNE